MDCAWLYPQIDRTPIGKTSLDPFLFFCLLRYNDWAASYYHSLTRYLCYLTNSYDCCVPFWWLWDAMIQFPSSLRQSGTVCWYRFWSSSECLSVERFSFRISGRSVLLNFSIASPYWIGSSRSRSTGTWCIPAAYFSYNFYAPSLTFPRLSWWSNWC